MSGSNDNTLKVWDASNRASIASTPRGAQVICVAVLRNGRVVSGSRDRRLKVWEDTEGKMAHLMARLIALRRTQTNFAGRAIAEFL